MAKVLIETYGCTLNQADSDIMQSILKERGFEVEQGEYKQDESYDYVIVNTCTVKMQTEQKILSKLGRIKHLGNRLVVTGCLASANKDKVSSVAPNASILNTSNIVKINDALEEIRNGKQAIYDTYNRSDKLTNQISNGSVIAKIPVSEGCLSSCSFCETKFARGPLNSFSEQLILKAIEMNVKKGAREVELTSQDTGAYGLDRKTNIAKLAKNASELDGEFRIRIGMLNPEHLHKYFDELIEAYKSEKVYKFIHLPLQSGSDKVLSDMKRKYTVEEFRNFVNEIREEIPGISIETDMIVGYPTETNEDFEESINFLGEFKPTFTNISKFSTREHAPASKLKQIKSETIKERSIEMSRFVRKMQKESFDYYKGRIEKVLITEKNSKSFSGRSDSYINVALSGDNLEIGSFVNAKIVENTFAYLVGKELNQEIYAKDEVVSKI